MGLSPGIMRKMKFFLRTLVLGLILLASNGVAKASVVVIGPSGGGFLVAGDIPNPIQIEVAIEVTAEFPDDPFVTSGTGYVAQGGVNEAVLLDYRLWGFPCCEGETLTGTITISDTNREIYGGFSFLYEHNLISFYPEILVYLPPGISAVPEPSTWAMLLIGFAGIGFASYRKRRQPA